MLFTALPWAAARACSRRVRWTILVTQDAPASLGQFGEIWFVVEILTLEQEDDYVQLLFAPQDSDCIIRISFNLWEF